MSCGREEGKGVGPRDKDTRRTRVQGRVPGMRSFTAFCPQHGAPENLFFLHKIYINKKHSHNLNILKLKKIMHDIIIVE